MVPKVFIIIALILYSLAPSRCEPVETHNGELPVSTDNVPPRSLWKRFIDSTSSVSGFTRSGLGKRMTRSAEEQCEQLQLCRLHARSASSFFAAFELYFVNKENARLWDHRARSQADCDRRFSCDR